MKVKSVVLLAVAGGCGLVAMLGVQQVLLGNRKAAPDDYAKVYVAAQEIPAGVMLDETMVKPEKRLKGSVPEGAVLDTKDFFERALTVKLFPGDVILKAKLGEKGKTGASLSIPEGMRVVTVPVNLQQTHSGLLQPGDHVDVLVTYIFKNAAAAQLQKTKTVLENITVFATDNVRDVDPNNADGSKSSSTKTVSLLVTPDQGQLLQLATAKGTLQLALRRLDDNSISNTGALDESVFDSARPSAGLATEEKREDTLNDFLKEAESKAPAPVVAAPKEKKTWSITIYGKDSQRVEEVELPDDPGDVSVDAAPAASEEAAREATATSA